LRRQELVLGGLRLPANFFGLALLIPRRVKLSPGFRELTLDFLRLLLRLADLVFGGERPLAGFLQPGFHLPDVSLKFLKLALRPQELVLGGLRLLANFFRLALRILLRVKLITGFRELILDFLRLLLRFPNLAFGGECALAGFFQPGFHLPDLGLKFLKLLAGFMRLIPGFQCLRLCRLNLAVNVAWEVLRCQRVVLGIAHLPLGGLQLPTRFRDGRERFAGLLPGLSEVKEVAFLFALPQAMESHTEEQRDQLDLGHLQVRFGVPGIVGQDFPVPGPMPRVHINLFAGRPGGIRRAIRMHRVTQRGNKAFIGR